MSLARVKVSVFAARKGKALTCEGCRKPIEKGSRYQWFKVGFRSRYVHTFHMGCHIADSIRESSKMAGIYAARESGEADINGIALEGEPDVLVSAIESVLENVASEWQGVAGEYRDAAEAMGSAGENMESTADSIESAADELESWNPDADAPEACDEHDEWQAEGCEECTSNGESWADEVRDSAISAINDAESNIEVSY